MNKIAKERMIIKQSILSHEIFINMFNYNPNTGVFTNKINRGTRARIGLESGHLDDSGYRVIVIEKTNYSSHRLAWFYVHKKWPEDEIDHINRIRDDNRICNLREANRSLNMTNKENPAEKQSGIKGINWKKKDNSWAIIYKDKRLCCTQTIEEGIKILSDAENGIFVKPHRLGALSMQSGIKGVTFDTERNKWKVFHNKKISGRRDSLSKALLLKLEMEFRDIMVA